MLRIAAVAFLALCPTLSMAAGSLAYRCAVAVGTAAEERSLGEFFFKAVDGNETWHDFEEEGVSGWCKVDQATPTQLDCGLLDADTGILSGSAAPLGTEVIESTLLYSINFKVISMHCAKQSSL